VSPVLTVELGTRGGGGEEEDSKPLIGATKGGGGGGCWMRRCLDPVETGLLVVEHYIQRWSKQGGETQQLARPPRLTLES
jgi:hypothetical protein